MQPTAASGTCRNPAAVVFCWDCKAACVRQFLSSRFGDVVATCMSHTMVVAWPQLARALGGCNVLPVCLVVLIWHVG
jgi:hypothetical protein